jgi:hypothetical protein
LPAEEASFIEAGADPERRTSPTSMHAPNSHLEAALRALHRRAKKARPRLELERDEEPTAE